jgi:hypothetical protein
MTDKQHYDGIWRKPLFNPVFPFALTFALAREIAQTDAG